VTVFLFLLDYFLLSHLRYTEAANNEDKKKKVFGKQSGEPNFLKKT
jgi:hypothetical protein